MYELRWTEKDRNAPFDDTDGSSVSEIRWELCNVCVTEHLSLIKCVNKLCVPSKLFTRSTEFSDMKTRLCQCWGTRRPIVWMVVSNDLVFNFVVLEKEEFVWSPDKGSWILHIQICVYEKIGLHGQKSSQEKGDNYDDKCHIIMKINILRFPSHLCKCRIPLVDKAAGEADG